MRRRIVILIGLLACTTPAFAQPPEAMMTYLQRRHALKADDITARLSLGQWCEANELPMQAGQMYRQVLAINPDHQQAYDWLVKIADTHRIPEDAERQKKLRDEFEGMSLHVTNHFLIVYDTSENWARNRAALLEKAHDVFYSTFRRVGFKPMPLKERLVCVLFADHDDYLEHGRTYDKAELGWAAGYYSTRTNLITFYDERQSPQFEEIKQKMAELNGGATQLREALKAAAAQRNHALVAEYRRRLEFVNKQLTWYRNRHEALSKVGNASKTVHEAVHQLSFNSGLQSRRVFYPFWLTEGLATNFETDTPARAFGPLHANDWRKATLRKAQEEDLLVPLKTLIAIGRPETDDARKLNTLYDQSWALFGYVFRYERDELETYLEKMLDTPPEIRDGPTLTAEFVEAFGDIDQLQARYDNYLKRLP